MTARLKRREFIKTAAASAGAAAGLGLLDLPYLLAAPAPTGDKAKVRVAMIGCGGRGVSAHVPELARQNLVAVIDPDEKHIGDALKKAGQEKGVDTTKIKTYSDYRKFFDEMSKEVDAIFVATPNHHHALPSLIAMSHGIGVYVEKPMAFNIWEARTMAQYANKYKVATQMGNQGHSGEGYRRLCEYIWAGALGNVTEVYHWTNRANGGVGPRPPALPVPAGMNWDSWIGPAPFREYHKDLHPHEWHGWYDFGNGSLGNMACHVMDGAVWALGLSKPTSIEVEDILGGSDERYPVGTRIRWDYAARTGVGPKNLAMPPVKVWWYDGKKAGAQNASAQQAGQALTADSVNAAAANRPPIMDEWEKKLGRKFNTDSCTFYVGDKGVMYTGTYGNGVRLLPDEFQAATPVPPEMIPRILHQSHQDNFFIAVKGGPPAVASFDYSSILTEVMLLGDLAIMAGKGNKIMWDGNQVTNIPAMNAHLRRQPRKGWVYPA
ncbi:MAG: Gfo/Idh/MocA family oxidoreductase [Abitibacteriaceae bacterium]|nr:Gfo/Idh/MocA family oxidoreductase [Abditibacteriaceae bacterium]